MCSDRPRRDAVSPEMARPRRVSEDHHQRGHPVAGPIRVLTSEDLPNWFRSYTPGWYPCHRQSMCTTMLRGSTVSWVTGFTAKFAIAGMAVAGAALAAAAPAVSDPATPSPIPLPSDPAVPAGDPAQPVVASGDPADPLPPPVHQPSVPEIPNPQYGSGQSGSGVLGTIMDLWHQVRDPYYAPEDGTGPSSGVPSGAGPAPQLPPGFVSLNAPGSEAPAKAATPASGGPPLPPGYYSLDGPPPPGYQYGSLALPDPAAPPATTPLIPTP